MPYICHIIDKKFQQNVALKTKIARDKEYFVTRYFHRSKFMLRIKNELDNHRDRCIAFNPTM